MVATVWERLLHLFGVYVLFRRLEWVYVGGKRERRQRPAVVDEVVPRSLLAKLVPFPSFLQIVLGARTPRVFPWRVAVERKVGHPPWPAVGAGLLAYSL